MPTPPTALASTPTVDGPAATPIPPRFRWLKRFAIGFFALVALILAFHFWWDHRSRQIWDAYIAERRAAGEPVLAEDLVTPDVPDDENGALLLSEIGPRASLLENTGTAPILEFSADIDAIHSFQSVAIGELEANRDLLCALDSLRDRPAADWKVKPTSPLMGTWLPSLSHPRAIARLCAFAAAVEHDRCNDDRAIEHVLTGLDVSAHVRRGQMFLIGELVALACDSLMCEAIEAIQPGLIVDDVGADGAAARYRIRQLIAILLDESEARSRAKYAMYFERTMFLDTFDCLASGTLPPVVVGLPRLGTLAPLLPAWRARCIPVARRLDGLIDALRAPSFDEAKRLMPAVPEAAAAGPAFVADAFRAAMEGDCSGAVRMHYHALAVRRMAATALAMRLFELDCGGPPESLDELVPDYLPSVPLDPMDGDGRPTRYVRTEDLPRLYSVGSDGIDEGGRIDWTYGFPQSPRQEEILFFLTERPRRLRYDLFFMLLKLYELPASADDATTGDDGAPPSDNTSDADKSADEDSPKERS